MPTPTGSVAEIDAVGWRFDATYARVPEDLFTPATPAKVPGARLSILNHRLAGEIGLDLAALSPDAAAALFAGQALPAGSRPMAQAYAGHQFGGFTMLGDGRAILLGEHRTPDGRLVNIQFKGSGRTRFSRGGDGKAALGPMLREYLISEAMAALGIPTTRGLAVVTTGERVYRESILRGAILTRVAASHIRVGTFEYAALRGGVDPPCDRRLCDQPPLPGIGRSPAKVPGILPGGRRSPGLADRPVAARRVHPRGDEYRQRGDLRRDDRLRAVHFMNTFDPDTVFSSIDRGGRYAYGNQPGIMQWNLARLGEALLPLLDPDRETSWGSRPRCWKNSPPGSRVTGSPECGGNWGSGRKRPGTPN